MKFEGFSQKPNEKNYYEILGVSPDATPEEIKKAYRKLVKETHPDQVGNESRKEEFLKANEAYETLKDKNKKEKHDQSILKEKRESHNRGEYDDWDEDWKEFCDEIKKDKTLNLMFTLSRGKSNLEKDVREYLNNAFQIFKKKKEQEEELRDLTRKCETLKKKDEELRKEWKNFRSSQNYNGTYERKNTRNLTGGLGVERDILGNEKLVSLKTGQQVGYESFKSIEYISGVIIATDIIGYKRVLDRNGEHSYETFKDIIVKDGLVVGKDVLGYEKLIDKNTGKSISHRNYKKIVKENGVIYGINIFGQKEKIC